MSHVGLPNPLCIPSYVGTNLVRKVADDETDVTRCPQAQARNNAVRRNAGVNKGEQALYPDYLQVTVGTGSV